MAQDPLKSFVSASAPGAESLPKVNTIFDFSAESLGQLRTWLEQNPPAIPITQIIGFTGFTALSNYVAALYQTTTSTFQNPGPLLNGVSKGQYIAFWGAQAEGTATSSAEMELFVNTTDIGATATTRSTTFTSIMAASPVTVTQENSQVSIQVRSTDNSSTCSWQGRFLILLKYANA